MSPVLHVCAHPGCNRFVANGARRCASHPLQGRGHEHQQARKVVLATATVCAVCGEVPTADNPLTLGHIVPRANGGTLARANLRAECARCNYRRGAKEDAR